MRPRPRRCRRPRRRATAPGRSPGAFQLRRGASSSYWPRTSWGRALPARKRRATTAPAGKDALVHDPAGFYHPGRPFPNGTPYAMIRSNWSEHGAKGTQKDQDRRPGSRHSRKDPDQRRPREDGRHDRRMDRQPDGDPGAPHRPAGPGDVRPGHGSRRERPAERRPRDRGHRPHPGRHEHAGHDLPVDGLLDPEGAQSRADSRPGHIGRMHGGPVTG